MGYYSKYKIEFIYNTQDALRNAVEEFHAKAYDKANWLPDSFVQGYVEQEADYSPS